MKSVKNFFIERINSIDSSESSSRGSMKKKHQTDKLKLSTSSGAAGVGSGGAISPNDALPIGDLTISAGATSPSIVSISGGDPSPSPSITTHITAGDNNVVTPLIAGGGGDDGDASNDARSPTSVSNELQKTSPFNFTPAGSGSVTNSLSAPAIKPQKSRRKISLPWFRQSSVITHAPLSRQYTIDSPGSFRFLRQASSKFKIGSTQESTWVVSDYIATPGSNELTVTKGQQVEVVEAPTATEPDFCLVRLNPQSDDAAVQEGLVPVSILKPPPGSQKTSSTRNKDNNESLQEQSNNRSKPDPLTSSTKRRGFSGRKWLPQPLRKLSQSKVEKPASEKSLIKKASEKNLKLPQKHAEQEEESTTAAAAVSVYSRATAASSGAAGLQNAIQADYEAEEEAGLELPPPMKPIQEPHLMTNGPPAFAKDSKENSTNMANSGKMDGNPPIDLSEIEQIVKEKTEQHEEKSKFLKPNFDISNGAGGSNEVDSCYTNNDNNDENNAEVNDTEVAQKKRLCALAELLSTEELYIQDLGDIVNGYIGEIRNPNSDIPLPEDLKGGKERMVFGNIEAIYEWHRDYFLKTLQRCQKSPAELGACIKRCERKFHMYIVYCQNKPVSEHIVTEHFSYFDQIRQKLRHRLDLSDLLIKPVQRIMKYELLLKEITKQTERAGLVEEVSSMEESLHVMKVVCKAVNDMMVLRRLQKFEGKITAQGKLLLHGPLMCIEDAKSAERNASMVQKPRELQVFLFEQSIIFSDILGKKTQFTTPTFIYRAHIQVNKMQLEELANDRFLLKSTDPNRPDLNMVCSAATIALNHEWVGTIRNILQSQHDFLKAITSPIQYQKELTRET